VRGLPLVPAAPPIDFEWRLNLRVAAGKLVQQGGAEVHAAAYLRQRRLILDAALRRSPAELKRILVHELFHFVWVRLSNSERNSWAELISGEFQKHARGELGWSAEWRKDALKRRAQGRRWREYLCESFCDSAAWHFSGPGAQSDEFTLAQRFARRRAAWLDGLAKARCYQLPV